MSLQPEPPDTVAKKEPRTVIASTMQIVKAENQRRKREVQAMLGGAWGLYLALLGSIWFGNYSHDVIYGPMIRVLYLFWSSCICMPFLLALTVFLWDFRHRATLKERHILHDLIATKNRESIPALIELIERHETREEAIRCLTELLPRLAASDADLLNGTSRKTLHRVLWTTGWNNGRYLPDAEANADFVVAVLRGWVQVGDIAALSDVRRLAQYDAVTPSEWRVREAAQKCLPVLENLVQKARKGEHLLRPSHQPEVKPETLLRPATAMTETSAQELLRATTNNTIEKY